MADCLVRRERPDVRDLVPALFFLLRRIASMSMCMPSRRTRCTSRQICVNSDGFLSLTLLTTLLSFSSICLRRRRAMEALNLTYRSTTAGSAWIKWHPSAYICLYGRIWLKKRSAELSTLICTWHLSVSGYVIALVNNLTSMVRYSANCGCSPYCSRISAKSNTSHVCSYTK